MKENDFLQIYKDAYTSSNGNTRSESVAILNKLIYNNPNEFAFLSCNCINNSNLSVNDRKLIIIGLTKALRPNEGGEISIWGALNPDSREELKNSGFTILIDPNDELKDKAGNLIAALFVLDLKDENKWSQMIYSLSENVKHDDQNIQKAAIISLGYICENLFNDNYVNLENEQVDYLLGGICMGLTNFGELSKTSVVSLGYSINFLKPKLQDEAIRDYIFDLLVKLIIKAQTEQDIEVLSTTISCLEEISRVTFKFFEKYYQEIFKQILTCINIKFSRNLTITINEFFKVLLETEKEFKSQYFDNYWETLANYCLQSLLELDESLDDEEGGLSLKNSFFLLLNTINSIYISLTQSNLINFVYQYIESPDPKIKIVSLLVFESLLESSSQNELKKHLNDCFYGLLGFTKESNFQLKKQSIDFLNKLAEFHFNIIMKIDHFTQMLKTFLNILNFRSNDTDVWEIKIKVLKTMETIIISSTQHDFSQNLVEYIDPFFSVIFQSLLDCQNIFYINENFTLIFCFIVNVCNLKSFSNYYKHFQNLMIEIPLKFQKKEIQFIYIEAFQILLTTMLNRIQIEEKFKFCIDNKNPDKILEEGYQFIKNFCQKYNEIPDESLYYMAIILKHSPNYFENKVESYLNNFITQALKDFQKIRLFKNGVDAFLLIIKVFTDHSVNYVKDVIPLFLSYLNNPDFNRDLNRTIFYAFSDIAFLYPSSLVLHLDQLFIIINYAFEAIKLFLESEIKSNIENAHSLLEAIINLIICIVHGIYLSEENFNNYHNLIEDYILNYMKYLEDICVLLKNNEFEIFINILGLYVDFYQKKKNKDFLNMRFITNLIESIKYAPKTPDTIDFQIYIDNILNN